MDPSKKPEYLIGMNMFHEASFSKNLNFKKGRSVIILCCCGLHAQASRIVNNLSENPMTSIQLSKLVDQYGEYTTFVCRSDDFLTVERLNGCRESHKIECVLAIYQPKKNG